MSRHKLICNAAQDLGAINTSMRGEFDAVNPGILARATLRWVWAGDELEEPH